MGPRSRGMTPDEELADLQKKYALLGEQSGREGGGEGTSPRGVTLPNSTTNLGLCHRRTPAPPRRLAVLRRCPLADPRPPLSSPLLDTPRLPSPVCRGRPKGVL